MTVPVPNKYFLYPFSVLGDATAIPETGTGSSSVNYQYGWTTPYSLPNATIGSLPVPRLQMNQLMFDITYALKQLQTQGYPLWVSVVDGGPADYPIYSYVAYDTGSGVRIWESQIANNTSVPGADLNWIAVSGGSQWVPVGSVIDFAGPIIPNFYFVCDGTTRNRITYAKLFNAITQVQSGTTTISMTTVTGLTNATTQMFAGMVVEGANLQANTTIASITNDTTIELSLTATATGADNIRFFTYDAGDGSTTYTLPDFRAYVTAGAGGVGIPITGSPTLLITGEKGGSPSYLQKSTDVAPHTHPGSTATINSFHSSNGTIGTPRDYYVTPTSAPVITPTTLPLVISASATGSSQTTMTTVQQTAMLWKCIKYV